MLQGKIFERVDRSQFRLPILPLQRISLSLNFVNSSTGTYLSTTTSATAGSSSPSHGRTKRRGRSLWRCHCIPFTTTAILIGSLGIVLLVQLALLRDAHSKVTIAATSNLQVSPTTSLLELFLRDFQKNANNPLPSRQTMEAADAFFNGVPLTLQRRESKHFVSHSHCVGENYRPDAWKHRSCRFSNLCFNMTSKTFVVFTTHAERTLSAYLAQNVFMHASSTLLRYGANHTQSVAIGGINQKWGEQGMDRMEWFPEIKVISDDGMNNATYYTVPDHVVLIPFHSLNGANPGHLVWDDFLPIYTLLEMFQLLEDYSSSFSSTKLLPIRYVLQDGQPGLWASCDFRTGKTVDCHNMMRKFGPLLVGDPEHPPESASSSSFFPILTSTEDFVFTTKHQDSNQDMATPPSELICAKTAVAGIGALTDHGLHKSHGWERADYETSHNDGRGGSLYRFRNFMLQNIGVPIRPIVPELSHVHARRRIVFSQASSDILSRSEMFHKELPLIRAQFPRELVQNYTFKTLSLREQVQIASETSIFISLCGGGAVTAMFLPKGASVILYYREDGGVEENIFTGKPARLDWDLFNSMSHLRVHWMPEKTMGGRLDKTTLVLLIQHELELMQSQTFA